MVRQEADGTGQPFTGGECIAQATPVQALEHRRYVLGQPRGKCRLADAPQAQHRNQTTALLQDPCAKGRQLFRTVHKPKDVGRLAPVLAPLLLDNIIFRAGDGLRRWDDVGRWKQCRRMLSEERVEPGSVQSCVHTQCLA